MSLFQYWNRKNCFIPKERKKTIMEIKLIFIMFAKFQSNRIPGSVDNFIQINHQLKCIKHDLWVVAM